MYTVDNPADVVNSLTSPEKIPQKKSESLLPRCSLCQKPARYRCPRCALRTCSVECVKSHKRVSGCTGVRDRCAYVALNNFTESDLQSDYRLLEEAANVVDVSSRDKIVKPHRPPVLPVKLVNMQKVAWKSARINLQFLPEMFARRKLNRISIKKGILHWTIAVEIPQAGLSLLKHNVSSAGLLKDVVHDFIRDFTEPEKQSACAIINAPFLELAVYLKAEGRPANDERYHQLDTDLSVEENLREKQIIEYPTFWLSTRDHSGVFPLLQTVNTKTNVDVKLPSFFQEVDDSD